MDAPAWLAPHLAPQERVRWSEAPGPAAWRSAIVWVGIAAFLTFYVGIETPSWWTYLPIWPDDVVSPVVGALVGGLAFAGKAADDVVRIRYTAHAVTDQRIVRVRLLGAGRAESWPLAQARVVERERDERRARVRVEVRAPDGRRLARFRITARDEPELLLAALPA